MVLNKNGATLGSTGYMFTRKGRVKLKAGGGAGEGEDKGGARKTVEDMLEMALEAGALDIADENGRIVVWTEISELSTVAERMREMTGLEIEEMDLVWEPNEVLPEPGQEDKDKLVDIIDKLREIPNVRGIYMNVKLKDLD